VVFGLGLYKECCSTSCLSGTSAHIFVRLRFANCTGTVLPCASCTDWSFCFWAAKSEG